MAYRGRGGRRGEARRGLAEHRSHTAYEHNFSMIPKADIPRSSFNRSHCHKTCFNAGDLIPFYVDEVLPGDTFAAQVHLFARLTTPIVPIMDSLFLETFYFFVPNRLLWEHWQQFNGEQDNPGDSTDYLVPQVTWDNGSVVETGDLADFMGIPKNCENIQFNALHFRAYNLIYNLWFRDQNLIDSVPCPIDDGPDPYSNYVVQQRAKAHDYFTSCLPWPQKGPAVGLPIAGEAQVFGDNYPIGLWDGQNDFQMVHDNDPLGSGVITDDELPKVADDIDFNQSMYVGLEPHGHPSSHMFADLSTSTAATINALREAFQLQRLYERDARGGTRYTEIIRSHFGVVSPDARLQRPEYLGGSSTRINVHPVAKTSSTDDTSPQGWLAAFGVGHDSKGGFRRSFTEHGVIIGLVNVRSELTYQQGLNRMWSRQTRFDFYWPALSHIGEQAVLNQEIFCSNNPDWEGQAVFGYQERWAEYRYFPSMVTGILNSTDTYGTPMDMWHLASYFESQPALNGEFIADDTQSKLDRCLAVHSANDTPQIIFDSFMDLKCARPMPVYSVPGLIDHF